MQARSETLKRVQGAGFLFSERQLWYDVWHKQAGLHMRVKIDEGDSREGWWTGAEGGAGPTNATDDR